MDKNKEKIITRIADILIVLLFFSTALAWAFLISEHTAPDEYMRYLVPKFIYNHGSLPMPNDKEVVYSVWNASYAYFPLLLDSIFCAIIMKVVSLFGVQGMGLLIAARFVSVLSGTGFVIFLIKIANRLFKNKKTKYFAIILGTFIPQFIYISSYVNNDAMALLSSSIIVYSWIWAVQENWNIKNTILLAIGIIICALTYYNAYAWILMSIIFFVLSFISKNNGEENADKKGKKSNIVFDYKSILKYGIIISMIVLAGISFFFIRSYIVNDGDMLGRESFSKAAEEGAREELKPSNTQTFKKEGKSCFEMLMTPGILGHNWIKESFLSFVCVLGRMDFYIADGYYIFYAVLFLIGLIAMIPAFVLKTKQNPRMKLFYISLLIAGIVPILLSINYSYSSDYQPQRTILISNVDFTCFICGNRNGNNI